MCPSSTILDRLEPFTKAVSEADLEPSANDLGFLAGWLGEPTVVGLGEATHGTSEFYAAKRALLEHLVREEGIRALGLESDFAGTNALDEYVTFGNGAPVDALEQLDLWMYQTREMLELVEWLRAFNTERSLDDRIRIYGIDMRVAARSAQAVKRFFETTDPDYLRTVEDGLDVLADGAIHRAGPDALEAIAGLVADLQQRLNRRRDEYVAELSARSWRVVDHHLTVLNQRRRHRRARIDDAGDPFALRDEYMADNVATLLALDGRDAIAVWAHNGHVMRGATEGAWNHTPMGGYLEERYGNRYVVIGFDFHRGSFRAIPRGQDGSNRELRTFSVEPLEQNSRTETDIATSDDDAGQPTVTLSEALAADDREAVVLDVAGMASGTETGDWLEREHVLHSIGAVFDTEDPSRYRRTHVPAAELDVLWWIEQATVADPIRDAT